MLSLGKHERVPVAQIDLDKTNPRIRRFLEIYGDAITPERIWFALQYNDDDEASAGTSFNKLKNSIITMGGVIQPVILRVTGERFVCVEGNTRVALYQELHRSERDSRWELIPALIYDAIDEEGIEAIRLQAHLVGPRQWDPYSKAKHLHYLRTEAHFEWARLIDFCGGGEREIVELIDAYKDMESYYRPILPDDTSFDATRFSGFRELQKAGIKKAIYDSSFTLGDFSRWIHEGKLTPLSNVRKLPAILQNPKARKVFIAKNAKEAVKHLDREDVSDVLRQASVPDLARALSQAVESMQWSEAKVLKSNPSSNDAQAILEALEALSGLWKEIGD